MDFFDYIVMFFMVMFVGGLVEKTIEKRIDKLEITVVAFQCAYDPEEGAGDGSE